VPELTPPSATDGQRRRQARATVGRAASPQTASMRMRITRLPISSLAERNISFANGVMKELWATPATPFHFIGRCYVGKNV
jgi:hypothetical protein